MKLIQFDEVKNIYEYEKIRKDFREKAIAGKKQRRVHFGDKMTLVFENRESVLFQIQEMIRAEKIITDEGMKHEIETYNQLVPGENELSATLLIDITEKSMIKPVLDSLVGLGKDSLYFQIGEKKILSTFDEGQGDDDRISAVQYVKWKLTGDDKKNLADPKQTAALVCTHPNYTRMQELTTIERAALVQDLVESN